MKIGIITQPLLNNYGGILQNFALQQILKKLGHEAITIEYVSHYRLKIWFNYTLKTIFLLFCGKKKWRKFIPYYRNRNSKIDFFVQLYINKTKPVKKYSSDIIYKNNIEGLIVGSDQVWRPEYNNDLYSMFLSFVNDKNILKFSYAASFGVEELSYTKSQVQKCRELLYKFNSISVREKSGIYICQKYFNINAVEVLDPTLLLPQEEYEKLCSNIPISETKFLASYILDINKEKKRTICQIGKEMNLPIKFFSADLNASQSIPEWIAIFRDAEFIITDSYHGTLFSIIFKKNFISIANANRGLSRFTSILSSLSLEDRLINDLSSSNIPYMKNIKWTEVYKKLHDKQVESYEYLEKNLYKV